MASSIHHVAVLVEDVEGAVAFLGTHFGLEVEARVDVPEVGMHARLLRWGDVLIEVFQSDARCATLNGAPAKLDHLAVRVDDIAATVADLGTWGLAPETAEAVRSDGWLSHFLSEQPLGVRCQLLQSVDVPADGS